MMHLLSTILIATAFFSLALWLGLRGAQPERAHRRFNDWSQSPFSLFVIPPGVETPQQFATYTRVITYICLAAATIAYVATIIAAIGRAFHQ